MRQNSQLHLLHICRHGTLPSPHPHRGAAADGERPGLHLHCFYVSDGRHCTARGGGTLPTPLGLSLVLSEALSTRLQLQQQLPAASCSAGVCWGH